MTRTSHTNVALAIVTLTEKSILASSKIYSCYENADIFVMSKHIDKIKYTKNIISYNKLSDITKEIFYKYNAIIFIMATGIVIRHIAPYVNDKTTDPAIIVCDEKLEYAISLLSGHIGGANKICADLSKKIGIIPVITTATDVNEKGALDNIAKDLDAFDENQKDIYKKINYALANDDKVYLLSDIKIPKYIDLRGFTIIDDIHNLKNIKECENIIHITYKNITGYENKKNYTKIIPKKIMLGIGCKKNTDVEIMRKIVYDYLLQNNISPKSIQVIASIDIKKDEKAIINLSNELLANFIVFSADDIKSDKYYNTIPKNDFVASITGVNSVSLAVTKMLSDDNVIGTLYRDNGITIAMGVMK